MSLKRNVTIGLKCYLNKKKINFNNSQNYKLSEAYVASTDPGMFSTQGFFCRRKGNSGLAVCSMVGWRVRRVGNPSQQPTHVVCGQLLPLSNPQLCCAAAPAVQPPTSTSGVAPTPSSAVVHNPTHRPVTTL